jgi:hypothetical protein
MNHTSLVPVFIAAILFLIGAFFIRLAIIRRRDSRPVSRRARVWSVLLSSGMIVVGAIILAATER